MNTLASNEHNPGRRPHQVRRRLLTLASYFSLLLWSMVSTTAAAGQFGVQVVDERGRPVTGASVCLGLPGNYKQFAAVFTDNDGIARADVPNVPLVVTVSKTRFSGIRVSEPARAFSFTRKVTLSSGTPGPRCRAGSSLAGNDESVVRLERVAVNESARGQKILTPDAVGRPTEYRVSRSEQFTEIPWSTLRESITLPGQLADSEKVYLQVRRYQGSFRGWVEARSKPVTVYLQ